MNNVPAEDQSAVGIFVVLEGRRGEDLRRDKGTHAIIRRIDTTDKSREPASVPASSPEEKC